MRSLFFLLLLLFFGCSTHSQKCADNLKDKSLFDQFSGLPLSSKYGNVSSVKVVYDAKAEKIYFINSRFYQYHYEFCSLYLYDLTDLADFNVLNYSGADDRKYFLGNINYYPSISKYVLELSPSDHMTRQQLTVFYQKVAENTFVGKGLKILVNSAHLESLQAIENQSLPFVTSSEIYGGLTYQAVSCNETVGVLKIITGETPDWSDIKPDDIIVLKHIPNYLPLVRGIIVTEFQTPLSHLSLLGQNRKIPICVSKGIFENRKIIDLNGKQVRLVVQNDTFQLAPSSEIFKKREIKPIYLKKDLSVTGLVDVKKLNRKSSASVGNKAANFGELYQLSQRGGFKVPEAAFAIPFYYYKQHVSNTDLQQYFTELFSEKSGVLKAEELSGKLKEIREKIEQLPLDKNLIKLIASKLNQSTEYKQFRFRSSTNAEDANGFSGAGLYDSKTVDLNDPEKTIERAVKKVWASLWKEKAYLERSYFGIRQEDVLMGILVHRSFPNEAVNGVAITKNLYRENYIGFVVNAQKGDESVVQPNPKITCDQFVCFPDNAGEFYSNSIDIITYSSLNNGKLVMTQKEIHNLANQLESIKRHYALFSHGLFRKYSDFGLDVEFKLDAKTRELYIKQVRYFND